MSNLREIVRRHVISETKQELSAENVDQDAMVQFLIKEGHFDKKVDSILDAFRDELEKDSPKSIKRKRNKFVYASLSILLTILIAYGVNEEYWVVVAIVALINIVIHAFFTFWSE